MNDVTRALGIASFACLALVILALIGQIILSNS